MLGQLYRDGPLLIPDSQRAKHWLTQAAEHGLPEAQYALGKLFLFNNPEVQDPDGGIRWMTEAAAQGNAWAAYRLGKLYLEGNTVPKDVPKAVTNLTESAQQGNQYAQYVLGKLYLTGQDVKQDSERAWAYFYESAEQGIKYADFFLKHFDPASRPNVFLAATRLLHHLGQIFRENSVPPVASANLHIDRKRRQQLREKRITLGHKPDDHEEAPQQGMGGMTMKGW